MYVMFYLNIRSNTLKATEEKKTLKAFNKKNMKKWVFGKRLELDGESLND